MGKVKGLLDDNGKAMFLEGLSQDDLLALVIEEETKEQFDRVYKAGLKEGIKISFVLTIIPVLVGLLIYLNGSM